MYILKYLLCVADVEGKFDGSVCLISHDSVFFCWLGFVQLLTPSVEDGDVREELLQFIKVKNPKCTFAGARGGGRLSRAIIGSTSDYLGNIVSKWHLTRDNV